MVDDLLSRLNSLGVSAIGYVDDLVNKIKGKHEDNVRQLMQDALLVVSDWCAGEGLSINPSKAVVVPFTRKRTLNLSSVALNGITIGFSDEVKYLGIVLDKKKLNWNSDHCHVGLLPNVWQNLGSVPKGRILVIYHGG